jgi:hypothetical protein
MAVLKSKGVSERVVPLSVEVYQPSKVYCSDTVASFVGSSGFVTFSPYETIGCFP